MRKGKRILAFLLAFLMVASTMGSTGVTAYAKGTDSVYEVETEEITIVEETTVEETAVEEITVEETTVEETTVEETTVEETTVEETTVEETVADEPMAEVSFAEESEPYYGDEFPHIEGGKTKYSLSIDYDKMVTFSDEALLEIINYRKAQECRYESISVKYPDVNGEAQELVAKDVWNGLCDLLEDEDSDLIFMFIVEPDDESNWFKSCRDWNCFAPVKTEDDIVFDVDWSVTEPGEGFGLKFSNTTFPAQDVELQMYFETNSAVYDEVRNSFAEGKQAVLYCDGEFVVCNVWGFQNEEGSRVQFMINDINDLFSNTQYVLNAKTYTGDVSEDGTSGTYNLDINLKKDEINYYSDAEILSMLEWNQDAYGKVFGDVVFFDMIDDRTTPTTVSGNFVSATNQKTVSGNLINAASAIMLDEPEFNDGWLTFRENGNVFDVSLYKPGEVPAVADSVANITYTLTVEDGEVKLSFDAPEYNAEQLSLRMSYEKGSEMATALEAVFGENITRYDISVGEGYYSVTYDSTEQGVMITFNSVNELERNTPHDVFAGEKQETQEGVPGIITDNYGRRTLKLCAVDVEKENWAKGELKADLKKCKELIDAGEMEAFNEITIIQKNQENNVIYKEDYNFLLGLFKKNVYPSLYFDFNDAWNGGETEEYIWNFDNPKTTTADVSLNATYTPDESGAVKLQVSSAKYPADFVHIRVHTTPKSDVGKVLADTFGEIEEGKYNKKVASVKTLGSVNDVNYGGCIYSVDGKLDDPYATIDFNTGSLNKMGTTTLYLLPIQKYREKFSVGKPDGYQLITANTPDGAVKWKGYSTYYATVSEDGKLVPIRETNPDVGYMFSAGYTFEGKAITEVYESPIERNIVSMKFRNASMANPLVMEMNSVSDDWNGDVTDNLELLFYPTGTWANADELDWTVSGNAIERVGGEDSTEIKAVTPGEAIVTVTLKENPNVKAEAKIIVKPSIYDEFDVNSIKIRAIDGVDKTLKDLTEQLPEGFAWTQPDTAIAGNWTWEEFPVIYTAKDGRTVEFFLSVNKIMVADIQISAARENGPLDNGGAIKKDEKLYITPNIHILGVGGYDVKYFNDKVSAEYDLYFTPDDATQKMITIASEEEQWKGYYVFDASKFPVGKKTLTFLVNALDKEGNVRGTTKKATFTFNVSDKNIMNWHEVGMSRMTTGSDSIAIDALAAVGETGQIIISQPKEKYVKISAKTMDKNVCTVGAVTTKEEGYEIWTLINYTVKSAGRAYITLTAADDVKSNTTIRFDAIDVTPKVSNSVITYDKARNYNAMEVMLQMADGVSFGGEGVELPFTISGKQSDKFSIPVVGQEENIACLRIVVEDTNIKNGTYKLKINAPLYTNGSTLLSTPFETTITVKVKETKPSVKIKQTQKVNTVYSVPCYESFGRLDIVKNGDWNIYTLNIQDQSESKKCDYILYQCGPSSYYIALEQGGDPKNNKAKLVITPSDLNGITIEKNITIQTATKKPNLTFDKKSDVLYPNYNMSDYQSSVMKVVNHTPNSLSSGIKLEIKDGKNWVPIASDTPYTYETSKNSYRITQDGSGNVELTLLTSKKATDNFKFRVAYANIWQEGNYVEIPYKVKVDTSRPQLALGSSTLTLNKNADIYSFQVASTTLQLKGGKNIASDADDVSFTGNTLTAENVKNRYLNLEWNDGKLFASLADSDANLKTGKYEYYVEARTDCGYIGTTLTVNIVDKPQDKCVTLSGKKGSIDVLNREGTAITYKVKLSNVQGQVVGCHLVGQDANRFEAKYEDGKVCIYAINGLTYSTKQTYKVQPVIHVENDRSGYELKAKVQSIKVKQGKPKITVKAINGFDNVLYRDRSNELTFDISAMLGNTDVAIGWVQPANYQGDISINIHTDEDGAVYAFTISQHDEKEILQSGKTWKLKFDVHYRDAAGNEKVTQITQKVVIK